MELDVHIRFELRIGLKVDKNFLRRCTDTALLQLWMDGQGHAM